MCCLDSVNYFTGLRELKEVFRRVSLFLEPGGLFLFDVKSKEMFRRLGVNLTCEPKYEGAQLFHR